mgnify:CR=1 FL=1
MPDFQTVMCTWICEEERRPAFAGMTPFDRLTLRQAQGDKERDCYGPEFILSPAERLDAMTSKDKSTGFQPSRE